MTRTLVMHYLFTILMITLLSGCSTLKVDTDYDPSVELTPPKNFAVVHKALDGDDTLTDDRIIKALRVELTEKGYVESIQSEADIYFIFHTGVTSKTRIDTDYQHINMYPYSYGYGYQSVVIPRTRTYTYHEAKLIIDATLPKTNKIVWRGTAKDYLKDYDTPKEKSRYINKVVKALLENFPK